MILNFLKKYALPVLIGVHLVIISICTFSFISNADQAGYGIYKAYGFEGSVNGRILTQKSGAYYLPVGRGKIRINIHNPGASIGLELDINQSIAFRGSCSPCAALAFSFAAIVLSGRGMGSARSQETER